jgi:hypothetical protein
MLRRRTLLPRLLVVLGTVAFSRTTDAQETPAATAGQPAQANRHLGLYWNVNVGAGYLHATSTQQPEEPISAETSGLALGFGVALGGAVAEDWILAGDLSAWLVPSPSGWFGSQRLTLGTLGVTVTHYFMPANIFLGIGPVGTLLFIDYNIGVHHSSELGIGGKVSVGKEWWFGPGATSGVGFGLTFIACFNGYQRATWLTLFWGLELRYTSG